ncbi:MAG: GNAT family N-acetyltransferase [Verrucomicrobiia bacterium]
MQVRPATISDAQTIARIHVASWQAAYRGQMPDDFLNKLDVEKRAVFWRSRLTGQPRGVFVAELDSEIMGFCDLIPSRDKDTNPQTVAEIAAIYIHPNHWRQGAGRALCHRALETARLENFSAVTLWALASNTAARSFYETMGFRLDGATKTDLISHNHELHHVRFQISV